MAPEPVFARAKAQPARRDKQLWGRVRGLAVTANSERLRRSAGMYFLLVCAYGYLAVSVSIMTTFGHK